MAENTKIEWADHTFNPWTGCTKVSPGCDGCYAEAWAKRSGTVQWGPGAARRRTTAANWRLPLKWNAQAAAEGRRLRVFCASLADVFDNEVSPEWRADMFELIAATPHLDWLLLTKRVGNAHRMLDLTMDAIDRRQALGTAKVERLPWPWSNVWLGATVVNQEEADRDIPKLLAVPARVRFLSVEPMLGPVDLSIPLNVCQFDERSAWSPRNLRSHDTGLHWVICGGESGPHARPMHPDWARSLRDQCAAAGVPFLFKQWGEWLPVELPSGEECYAEDGSDRQFEGRVRVQRAGHQDFARIGKVAAGRLLDGLEHNGFPEVRHG